MHIFFVLYTEINIRIKRIRPNLGEMDKKGGLAGKAVSLYILKLSLVSNINYCITKRRKIIPLIKHSIPM